MVMRSQCKVLHDQGLVLLGMLKLHTKPYPPGAHGMDFCPMHGHYILVNFYDTTCVHTCDCCDKTCLALQVKEIMHYEIFNIIMRMFHNDMKTWGLRRILHVSI